MVGPSGVKLMLDMMMPFINRRFPKLICIEVEEEEVEIESIGGYLKAIPVFAEGVSFAFSHLIRHWFNSRISCSYQENLWLLQFRSSQRLINYQNSLVQTAECIAFLSCQYLANFKLVDLFRR